MYLSRVWIICCVFAAVLTQVWTVALPPVVAVRNIGVGPGFAAQRGDGAHCLRSLMVLMVNNKT
jgi:hypothetical protein